MASGEEPTEDVGRADGGWERKPAWCSLGTCYGLQRGAPCGLAMATSGSSILRMEATVGGRGGGEDARQASSAGEE